MTHDWRRAIVTTVSDYLHGRSVLDDLDIRASDILQANGIIWVEGPSDRLYLNRWIELWTVGALREGAHYQILQYGGSLLAHLDAEPPDTPSDTIHILTLNRNAAVLLERPTQRQRRPQADCGAHNGGIETRERVRMDHRRSHRRKLPPGDRARATREPAGGALRRRGQCLGDCTAYENSRQGTCGTPGDPASEPCGPCGNT